MKKTFFFEPRPCWPSLIYTSNTLSNIFFRMQTFFDSTLPMRAKYPIGVDSLETLVFFSLFQVIVSFFLIEGIVFIDGIGGQVMSQISLQFHILTLEFRTLGGTLNRDSEDPYYISQIKRDLHELIQRHQDLMELTKFFGVSMEQYNPFFFCFVSDLEGTLMSCINRCLWHN